MKLGGANLNRFLATTFFLDSVVRVFVSVLERDTVWAPAFVGFFVRVLVAFLVAFFFTLDGLIAITKPQTTIAVWMNCRN